MYGRLFKRGYDVYFRPKHTSRRFFGQAVTVPSPLKLSCGTSRHKMTALLAPSPLFYPCILFHKSLTIFDLNIERNNMTIKFSTKFFAASKPSLPLPLGASPSAHPAQHPSPSSPHSFSQTRNQAMSPPANSLSIFSSFSSSSILQARPFRPHNRACRALHHAIYGRVRL